MLKHGVVLLASIWGVYCATKQLVGPYDLVFHKMYECNGMPTGRNMIKYGTKFQVYNRTAILYSSNITYPNGFHDNMKGIVDISLLSNGVWRKNDINLRLNKMCSDANHLFPKLFPSLLDTAGTKFTGCPIKRGTYNVRNGTFNLQTATGVFPYNTNKVEITAVESGRKVMCFAIEVEVVVKQ